MYIMIILKNVYGENLNYWFAHALKFCRDYHCPLITNRGFADYPLQFNNEQENKYEIESLEHDILSKVEIYYMPEGIYGGRNELWTDFSLHLFRERDPMFENFMEGTLECIRKKHKEKIEGFISFGQGYYSLDYFAKTHHFRCIRGDASPIRKNDGYTQMLYWGTMDTPLYNSRQCEERYQNFLAEKPEVPFLTRQELIALFGKEETLPLIPLMYAKPQYEMGICEAGYHFNPHCFAIEQSTDDDLWFESRNYFERSKITKRQHPTHYTELERLENRKNAENFILSCRRTCAIASNTIMLTMMWNRVACCPNNLLSCAFMAEHDFSSEKIVDLKFLNFLIFAYQVPGWENFFSPEYWNWRYSYPKESEIYQRHLDICLAKAGVDKSFLHRQEKERITYLLERRGCDKAVIEDIVYSIEKPLELQQEEIVYQTAVSCLAVNGKKHYCRNHFQKDKIQSKFNVSEGEGTEAQFIPLGDMAGFVTIYRFMILDGRGKKVISEKKPVARFFQKNDFESFTVNLDTNVEIVVEWFYKDIFSTLTNEAVWSGDQTEKYQFSPKRVPMGIREEKIIWENPLYSGANESGVNRMGKKYHVLLSADDNYLMQAVVCIHSIILNNRDMELVFHVLYSKISDDAKEDVSKWMESQYSGTDICFHRVMEENYIFPIKPGDAVSIETYFRILAPDILPSDIKSILYVDCDTITVGSLRDLFDMNLDGYALGCARGAAEESRKYFLGLKPSDPYFQAGVMLMNLEYWREHGVGQKVLEFIQENRDNLPRHEQDAMNAVLAGKYILLEQKWNTCLGAAPRDKKFREEPVILHYTGYHRYKPWWKNTLSRWQDVYLRYRAGTPYESVALKWCEQYQYKFDEKRIPKSSKVILYAAGDVGKDFYEQNQKNAFCKIIAWVDKNYQRFENSEYPVQDLQALWNCQYDFVLIAVKQEEVAKEIERELQEAGIHQAKLIWLAPL